MKVSASVELRMSAITLVAVILAISRCECQKMPTIYYHHQIPIKIVHGYTLTPVYGDKHGPSHMPMSHQPHRPPSYPMMYSRPVAIQMAPLPHHQPVQLDQQKRNYLHLMHKKPGGQHVSFQPSPIDYGFKPMIKPSVPTFHDHSAPDKELPNINYVRNYVDQLKQRQKEHFTSDPEIEYFKHREHEIGNPPSSIDPGNHSPNSHPLYQVSDDTVDDESDDQRGYQAQSSEEHSYANEQVGQGEESNSEETPQRYNDDPHEVSAEETDEPYRVSFGNRYENDPFADEESKKLESVSPLKVYSQVRHSDTRHKARKPDDSPRVKEKLSTGKTHIVYKEEGYEDNNYDHLDAVKTGENHFEKHKKAKRGSSRKQATSTVAPPRSKSRNKREAEALALTIFKNSSFYDRSSEQEQDQVASPSDVFQVLDPVSASQENYKSLYRSKSPVQCNAGHLENLTDDSFNGTVKKRGGQLGDKLDCLKTKYFGKSPFESEFFKNRVNLSKIVYDDIMQHITKPQTELSRKTINASPFNGLEPAQSASSHVYSTEGEVFSPLVFPTPTTERYEIPSLSSLPLRKDKTRLHSSIFDINKFYPTAPGSKTEKPVPWTEITFTTSKPQVFEPVPQHSRPYRSYVRPPYRWVLPNGWALRPRLS